MIGIALGGLVALVVLSTNTNETAGFSDFEEEVFSLLVVLSYIFVCERVEYWLRKGYR